ncbi:hypothetical protein [Aureliella helgolandensis]|uniref:Lipoprotein n=1 Tax=Aureliella helgolandensis TaxID=2527968 RepID=A0A518G5J5_9BACT|nr:hypothetical protein [Aureliella helgolandensis]QDV23839.1 hypothetical protein Q31a_21450 [Aureliella helgolandensis]
MRRLSLALVSLIVLCASCNQDSPESARQASDEDNHTKTTNRDTVESGNLGVQSTLEGDERFSSTLPYIRRGRDLMILGLLEDPEHPWRPALVLLLKLASPTSVNVTYTNQRVGEMQLLRRGYLTSVGERFPIEYRYTKSQVPVTDALALGGKDFPLDSGRVFTIDLSKDPVQITQLSLEIPYSIPDGATVATMENDITTEHLENLRDDLAAKNSQVKDFVAKR